MALAYGAQVLHGTAVDVGASCLKVHTNSTFKDLCPAYENSFMTTFVADKLGGTGEPREAVDVSQWQ